MIGDSKSAHSCGDCSQQRKFTVQKNLRERERESRERESSRERERMSRERERVERERE